MFGQFLFEVSDFRFIQSEYGARAQESAER